MDASVASLGSHPAIVETIASLQFPLFMVRRKLIDRQNQSLSRQPLRLVQQSTLLQELERKLLYLPRRKVRQLLAIKEALEVSVVPRAVVDMGLSAVVLAKSACRH
jgi:hypothetical protein